MDIKKSLTKIASAITLLAVTGCATLNVAENSRPRKMASVIGDINKDGKDETIVCLGDYYFHCPGQNRISLHEFTDNYEGGIDMQCFAYLTNNYSINEAEVKLKLEDRFKKDGYLDLVMVVSNKFIGKEDTYFYENCGGKFRRLGGNNYQD